MKYFMLAGFCTFLLISCYKKASIPSVNTASKISVTKDNTVWESDGVYSSYNIDKDIIYVVSGKDNESFTISFKKGSIPTDGVMKNFLAGVLVAPFKGSAAIADIYYLDTTKPNKLKIIAIENAKRRIAGDFLLYLKRDKQDTMIDETNIFQGRFDVHYDSFSLK